MSGLISALRQARQKPVPWVATGKAGTVGTQPTSTQREPRIWEFASTHSTLIWWGGTMESEFYKLSPLFSAALNLMPFPVSVQIQTRQKLIPWVVPPKIQNADLRSRFLFFYPRS